MITSSQGGGSPEDNFITRGPRVTAVLDGLNHNNLNIENNLNFSSVDQNHYFPGGESLKNERRIITLNASSTS
jgi:hypothetical protein